MRLEHHLVGGYVRYISPHIIIIINDEFKTLIRFERHVVPNSVSLFKDRMIHSDM